MDAEGDLLVGKRTAVFGLDLWAQAWCKRSTRPTWFFGASSHVVNFAAGTMELKLARNEANTDPEKRRWMIQARLQRVQTNEPDSREFPHFIRRHRRDKLG
jgi:hypothetical protein